MQKKFIKNLIFILLVLCSCFCLLFVAGCSDSSKEPELYTITFVTGVDEVTVDAITGEAGSEVTEPAAPQRDGYRFGGWSYKGELYVFDVMPGEDVTLTAIWTKLYTIAFDTEAEGLTIDAITGEAGSEVTEPAEPHRDGYRFDGWSYKGELYVFDVMPEEDITLTAIWTKLYTIAFDTGVEWLNIEDITGEAGSEVTEPAEPHRDGYRFDGWSYKGELYVFDVMPEEDVTLTAIWTKLYTITFDTGIEGLILTFTAEAGSEITAPVNLQRAGYRFDGWALNGNAYTLDVMPEENLTLTVIWTQLFTVTFESGTDKEIPQMQYAEGEIIEEPEALTSEGYRFLFWLLDGEPYEFGEMPGKDIILVAEWQKVTTITFETGTAGFRVAPIIEAPGTVISAPDVRRTGYYLRCWRLEGTVYEFTEMPEEDIVLVAEWVELTNLPAMFIDIYDEEGKTFPLANVTKEDYVESLITLTNTDEEYELNSLKSEFKGRGNGSWVEDKKSYKIKFDKKQSVFGREKNKHWVIIACASLGEVTMSRNYLAYNMAREILDGIEYTTPAYWIDVYVNGEYRGVYLLCEHVRVGEGRVDIESAYGVEDTGYLIEYDAYYSGKEGIDYFRVDGLKYAFTIHSPDPEEFETDGKITEERYRQQIEFIKNYVTLVYNAALSGDYATFSELADTDSFVDMYILHELFKNMDTGWSSFYLYKKPGEKLYAGPAWDFDGTTHSVGSPDGIYVAGSVETERPYTASELYISLYQTEGFLQDVKARWQEFSPKIRVFIDNKLNEEVYEENKAAMGKNFALWKGKSQEDAEKYWVDNVNVLKKWLIDRIDWLDNEWRLQ